MADVKTLLKEARKLIDEKKFVDAQECCKNILRKDKDNYFGLVLLGKALQESDHAELAYQKAIAAKPENPLAWQGLANYYEKIASDLVMPKLLNTYSVLLNIQTEEDKVIEIIPKLGKLGSRLQSKDVISVLIKVRNKYKGTKIKSVAEQEIIELLKSNIFLCSKDLISSVVAILSEVEEVKPNENLELLIAKIILEKDNFSSAVTEIISLIFFDTNTILREFICKQLCYFYIKNETFDDFKIDNYTNRITHGIENSKYPELLKSIIAYHNKEYLDAYQLCVPLINYNFPDVLEAKLILKCTVNLKKWSLTTKLAKTFLTRIKNEEIGSYLKKILFISLCKQKQWDQALVLASEIPRETMNDEELILLAKCLMEQNRAVESIIEKIKNKENATHLQAMLYLKQEKYDETIKLLETFPENGNNLLHKAKAYWNLKQFDVCYVALLRAAKMGFINAEIFLYLGYFYELIQGDLHKAKKCFEKAYSLEDSNSEIANNLSKTYAKLGLSEKDFEFLIELEKSRQINESWIPFRLGLHYLTKRDWENAIISFRNVIKLDQHHTTAFECLADAYYSRGSLTSALKAYNKVMTLNPQRICYCLTRIGYIYSLLTQYLEAIATFEKVLSIDPNSLLALKGISETWIRIAKKKMSSNLYGSARDCAQNAINFTIQALSKQKQYLCLWKLLGDTLMFVTTLPNKYSYIFTKDYEKDSLNMIRKDKIQILLKAIACYSHIVKQRHLLTSYDLAAAYLAFYYESRNFDYCQMSYNLVISCIKTKATNWKNWNLLAKVCFEMKKYNIAQHCFIKSLQVTRKWTLAAVWCNLGALYLKLNLHKIANYCFWRGQSTLPSYPHSWIGQGLIAEAIREDEAMDLFRHAARLGYHPESALGYADWVCRTLKLNETKIHTDLKYVIEGLHAIPYAMDLLEQFLSYHPNNACALTIFGILQERSGLIKTAFKSYKKAFECAVCDKKNIALLNLGRILVQIQEYDEAVIVYKSITEASLHSTCGLALALLKKGLYEESYAAYDTALQWLSDDDADKANLLVAMAGIVFMFKSADDAKTLLFHSIRISQNKPTAFSLLAICALGIIQSDQNLSKLAVSELKKFERESKFGFDIGFLKSYLQISEDNYEKAIKLISESLHDHPNEAMLWFCMAQYNLKDSNTKAKIASNCAQRALCCAQLKNDLCEPAKMLATASVSEQLMGDSKHALTLAKLGLHMYPNSPEIWACLLFCLSHHEMWVEKKECCTRVAVHLRRHLVISRPLSRWVGLVENKLAIN